MGRILACSAGIGIAAMLGLVACSAGDGGEQATFGGTGGPGLGPMDDCTPGEQTSCACSGGREGIQVCEDDGSSLGECQCDGKEDDADDDGGADMCGNEVCDADETCSSCETDCGVCEPCTIAPSCENAFIPGAIDTHADGLDVPQMNVVAPQEIFDRLTQEVESGGVGARLIAAALDAPQADEPALVTHTRAALSAHPSATAAIRRQLAAAGMGAPGLYRMQYPEPSADVLAAMDLRTAALMPTGELNPTFPVHGKRHVSDVCEDPSLRVRVAKIDVHEEDDDFANDIVYCLITSEAATASEVRVTPQTPNLDEGDSFEFALADGVAWGQKELAKPGGNLAMTYTCIEADTAGGYQALLDALAEGADGLDGAIPGVQGWVFPAAGVVIDLASAALALDGDDQLFNAQQIIPMDMMVPLTNGAWWSVRRSGTHILSDWDWELRMEVWGCVDNGVG